MRELIVSVGIAFVVTVHDGISLSKKFDPIFLFSAICVLNPVSLRLCSRVEDYGLLQVINDASFDPVH